MNTIFPDSFLDICIAISTSILTLFIPLFYSVITRLDEKYNSRLIIKLFWSEMIVKLFGVSSILLIISAILYSLKLKSIFGFNSFFITNSAPILNIFFIISSIILAIISICKLNIYQDPIRLFELIQKSNNLTDKERRIIRFDLLFHSMNDLNYNKDLSISIIDNLENAILKSSKEEDSLPVEYYDALEQLTAFVYSNNLIVNSRHNKSIVFRLWGTIFNNKYRNSENYYSWLWYHLSLSIEYGRDELVRNHWQRTDSIIKLLPVIKKDYDNDNTSDITYKNIGDEIINFHVVLCALLLHSNKNRLLNSCLVYTSTWPPSQNLLPDSIQNVINTANYFNNTIENSYLSISFKYPFPGSSGFEQDVLIKQKINQFLIILLFAKNADFENTTIYHHQNLNKFQCGDIIKACNKILNELESSRKDILKNEILDRNISNDEIIRLRMNIQKTIDNILTHKQKLMSQEPLDNQKIDDFCSKIGEFITPVIKELEKLKSEFQNDLTMNFQGIINSVNKDFFIAESEASYINYEKSFSSMFIENLKIKLAYFFYEKSIANFTLESDKIIEIVKNQKNFTIVNFGVRELMDIKKDNLINLGSTYNASPRVYLYNTLQMNSININFDKVELHHDFTRQSTVNGSNVLIGIEKLSKGNIAGQFSEIVPLDSDLENTIGIAIKSNMNLYSSSSFKCICLKEFQIYRDSKNPDKVNLNQLLEMLN
jgi:hypothetical protein